MIQIFFLVDLPEYLKNFSKQSLVYLLVSLLSGFSGFVSTVAAASKSSSMPILRHLPPAPLQAGEMLVIDTFVESEATLEKVMFLFRETGSRTFQKIRMTAGGEGLFEARLEITKKFEQGLEYYIEAIDQLGNKGRDGSRTRPYFLEVRPGKEHHALRSNVREDEEKRVKPFWKKTWFWLAIAAVGGGIAAAGGGGSGGSSASSGTIVVE